MDSSTATVDLVTNNFKKQSLENDDSNSSKRLLKLEELNWDHSFGRQLPPDPTTDIIPREFERPDFPLLFSGARPDFPHLFSGASPLVGA
ncbi:hypothetical protein RND71_002556 [Anisodus tanguticus]|uniref:Uncharacterized protein n=1 Tax=Anisodus tanguticus TaxID=243964 RepID=A0AAE1VYR3_9SOLA|nr:hypothetical protein RND71_002556 [Anisodus tanguticus]